MQNITPSGVEGFDRILYGGLPKGSTVIVEGAPGTGKTTFGVQFLYYGALQCNEPGIYITFEEFPKQIYQDVMAFGWDLKELEKRNLLRVVSIKPALLLNEMKKADGLFEQLVQEIGCQRIVIDSISLFQYLHHSQQENREALYSIRNILRKHGLTALLLSEQAAVQESRSSFEHYVVDGVIRLSLEEQMKKFRKRTLEVTKMRGRRIAEGEHIYRITEEGIHLIPALTMVEDKVNASNDQITTGIEQLDRLISGGITIGSAAILDTNSKANYQFIVHSILAEQIKQGNNILMITSSLSTVADHYQSLKLFDVDLDEVNKQGKVYFIEHFDRPVMSGFEKTIFNVKNLSNTEYWQYIAENITPLFIESLQKGEKWFVYYDLNTIYSHRGAEFFLKFFAEQTASTRAGDITLFAICNFAEIGAETASFLERTTNTVIRTWVDGSYQYLQVTKSTNGNVSEPKIVESIKKQPFIRLV